MRGNGDRHAVEAGVDGSQRGLRAVRWRPPTQRRAAVVVGGLLLPLAAIVLVSAALLRTAGLARLLCWSVRCCSPSALAWCRRRRTRSTWQRAWTLPSPRAPATPAAAPEGEIEVHRV